MLPPFGEKNRYPALDLTVIHAVEPNPPAGRKRIEWKLLTAIEMHRCEEGAKIFKWYAMGWKIDVFHKILKSGWRTEDANLRAADRLANLVAVFCNMSWRVLWLTIARTAPEKPPTAALTEQVIESSIK